MCWRRSRVPTALHDDQQDALFAPKAVAGTWQSGDGSVPVRLPDNRTAWLFGDSLIRRTDGGNTLVHSSIVVESADGTALSTVQGGTASAPASYLPAVNPGTFLWPSGGFIENASLYILASEFSDPGGAMTGNHFLYAVALPSMTLDTNWWGVYGGNVQWGHAVIQTGGYTYVYGNREVVEAGWTNHYTHLARFVTGQSHGYWQFWDGTGFGPAAPGAVLQGDTGPLQVQTGAVIRYASKWNTLSIDPFGQKIDMRASTNPWGPFGPKQTIYTVPVATEPNPYLPRGYPDGTKQQIAWSVNSPSRTRPDYARL